MLQSMNTMDFFPETLVHINDFELQDFIENPNFDHHHFMNGAGFVDNTFLSCPPNSSHLCNNNSVNSSSLGSFSCFDGEAKEGEENDGDNFSSATTITTSVNNTKPSSKTDRSKTLISERKRRGRMKDKLYALRSLVPNITKMDKASIIGDAASYVNELQSQAKKLKAEVAGLEASSLAMSKNYQEKPMKDIHFIDNNASICNKIVQMDMFQVDERGFYVKIVCNKGEGVATSLYRSLESIRGFNVQNSNLSTVSDTFLLTFSLNMKDPQPEIYLPNMKLWVISAFLNQGFEFIPFSQA